MNITMKLNKNKNKSRVFKSFNHIQKRKLILNLHLFKKPNKTL